MRWIDYLYVSFYIDMQASLQGIEAVKAVLRSTPDTPAPMIGTSEGKIISVSLMEAVKLVFNYFYNIRHTLSPILLLKRILQVLWTYGIRCLNLVMIHSLKPLY